MRITKQCYECHEQFRKTELIDYASPTARILHSYCPKCLAEKQARDRFSEKVCNIFGIKQPGPRLWTERKRLQDKYGYTDDTIVDCLDYIYNVEKAKKLTESLCLVTPTTIEKMQHYKHKKEIVSNNIIQAMQQPQIEHIVPIKKTEKQKVEWNPDDWLEDD